MTRYLRISLLLGLLGLWNLPAQAATSTTLQSAVAVDGNGSAASVFDYGNVALQVTITGKASVNFEGSADSGTTYSALACRRGGSTAGDVSTTSSSGLFFCNATGITNIRTPVVGWQTGTVTVVASVPGDSAGGAGVSLETLISGEDQTNNLLMTSGGVVRGTEGNIINSAVGDATSSAFTLPTGYKTFTGRITGAGAVTQTITIYGGTSASMSTTTSDIVCTIPLSGTSGGAGTGGSCPPFIAPFLFYKAVTSGSSGTPTTILTAGY